MTFEELKNDILACRDCREKFGFEPIPIVRGTANSKILQISQAPSKTVHLTKKPFNDLSGNRLKFEWYQITDDIFYNEENFYITALAHCFPGKSANGGDRSPPIACAKKWLHREIEVVDNEIFVIIGQKAAKFIFPDDRFEDLIFKDNILNGKPAFVMPHPSPLNIKWFKDHPEFEAGRVITIREKIWSVLGIH